MTNVSDRSWEYAHRPVSCPVCGDPFPRPVALRVHLRKAHDMHGYALQTAMRNTLVSLRLIDAAPQRVNPNQRIRGSEMLMTILAAGHSSVAVVIPKPYATALGIVKKTSVLIRLDLEHRELAIRVIPSSSPPVGAPKEPATASA